MKQQWITSIAFYVMAPIVVFAITLSLWFSVDALMANARLGNAFSQSIRIVEAARGLRVKQNESGERAAATLMDYLATQEIAEIEPLSGNFMGKEGEKGFVNPWGYSGSVQFRPDVKLFTLEMEAPAHACRKFLSLYADAIEAVGLRFVKVRSQAGGSAWRQVYIDPPVGTTKAIHPASIYSGCGDYGQTLISLTFLL